MKFERKLDASPEFLTAILENMNAGIMTCDTHFNITFYNSRIQEIYGIPKGIPSEDWELYIQVLEGDGVTPLPKERLPIVRALKGEKVVDSYNVVVSKMNGSLLVKNNAHPVYDKNGVIVGAMLTTEDSQDLAHTLSRFKAIFYQSPLSIQILDKTGKTILVNSAFQELWGISDEFVKNHILGDYNLLEDEILEEAGALESIKRAFAGEIMHVPEFLYDPTSRGLEGRPRWTTGMIYPLKDASGKVSEVVIIHEDTTERNSALAEKEKTLAQLQAIIRQMPAGVMVLSKAKEILLYNEQMRNLLGEPSNAKEILSSSFQVSMEGHPINSKEIEYVCRNGKVSALDTSFGPIHDNKENIFASVVIAKDITQEKRNERDQNFLTHVKSLLISTIDYDLILARIASATIPYLADGCIVDLLEGTEIKRIVTQHQDPLMHEQMKLTKELYPPQLGTPQPTSVVIQTGKPTMIESVDLSHVEGGTFNSEHADLIRKLEINSLICVPLTIRGKTIGAITVINSRDRVNLNRDDFSVAKELAHYAAVAINNAALYKDARSGIQLRDDFISMASHELRTPITSLQLQVQVLNSLVSGLENDPDVAQVMKKFLGSTNSQLKRLTRLVDDMLDISRIDTGKLTLNLKKVNLAGVILDVLDRFKDHLESQNISVELKYQADVYYECDPERIDQVMTNFMTNAIKYGKKKPIHVHLEENSTHVILRIQDFGRGISKADQERIFKRFEQAHTSEDVSGLGLGLYINQRIIDEHAGVISLESEVDKGSIFSVLFPKVRAV